MISIKQLNYALAVEKTLHFKKAAELCHVSQSTLSSALTELEKYLGLQVFERDNKKVLITPIGKQVLERAKDIMLGVSELQNLAESHKTPLSFPLSLGVIPTIAPYLLPLIFPDLSSQYPEAKLNIIEDQSHVLVEKVRCGELDTAILALPYPCDGLLNLEFWQEDFYWVGTTDAPLTHQDEITSAELKDAKLMLLTEGHCLKDHILDACKIASQDTSQSFSATSLNTLIQMVLGRMGTTLIPEMALQPLISQHKQLSAVHLNEPSPHRKIAFIIRPNYTRMSSIEALVQVCKKAINKTQRKD